MAQLTNLRDVRRKIHSVRNLKKITRAMEMVAASKLKKTQDRLMQIRTYADKIAELMAHLSGKVEKISHPLFEKRDVRTVGIIVISADKGLCGTYNSALIEHTRKFIRESGKPVRLLPIGKKAREFFTRKEPTEQIDAYEGLPTDVPFKVLAEITGKILAEFESGRVDEIYVEFTKFINALTFRPTRVRFIPVEPPEAPPEARRDEWSGVAYEFEPDPAKILDRLIPRFLETSLHRFFLEANSSEHAARMNAMRNATENASEMIDNLTLLHNKVRQANITKELLDIVGGAEVLKQ